MSDKLGDEIRNLMTAFYAAADECAAGLIAEKVVVKMKPLLRAWTTRPSAAPGDVMGSAEDFCVTAEAQLWEALCKSRRGERIRDVFAYARTICDHLLDGEARKHKPWHEGCSELLESIADENSSIIKFHKREEARQKLTALWEALAQCPLNGRHAVLLALPREIIHPWIGLPDACPALALMLEISEADARLLWVRLPLAEKESAEALDTTVSYLQKLRSITKKMMWELASKDCL